MLFTLQMKSLSLEAFQIEEQRMPVFFTLSTDYLKEREKADPHILSFFLKINSQVTNFPGL